MNLFQSKIIISFFAFITLTGGLYVYCCVYGLALIDAVTFSISLFALDTKIPNDFGLKPDEINNWKLIYIFSLTGAFTTFSAIIFIFLGNVVSSVKQFIMTFSGGHIIVMGLGRNNQIYVDSELKDKSKVLILEKDKNHPAIERYKTLGASMVIGDATDEITLNKLNLGKCRHIVISTGDDMINLEAASIVVSMLPEVKKPLFIHLQDRSLRHLHKDKDKSIFNSNEIKFYSYFEDTARSLFQQHDIDGAGRSVIDTEKPFGIALVGNTTLAHEVIAQACIMGQLPNENHMTIYCIDKDAELFKRDIELAYPQIENVPNVTLKYVGLDVLSRNFYLDDIWNKYLTNIIICFEDDQVNLDTASNLANLTYLEQIANNEFEAKILLAMRSEYRFSEIIDQNSEEFGIYAIFGRLSDICDKEYIVGAKRDKMAKGANDTYNKISKQGGLAWDELSYFKKESNRAVGDHCIVNIKSLNLAECELTEKLKEDSESMHKLSKCEHNRWMAFHYINGYKYGESKNERIKRHNCLISYKELNEQNKELDSAMVIGMIKFFLQQKRNK